MSSSGSFLLAIDVGTSSLKTIVYDRHGNCLAEASRRYAYSTPQPGWAEMQPQEWWQALKDALVELNSKQAELSSVESIALTGQMHTFVLLDDHGEVIEPTILWLDRRAAEETAQLVEKFRLPPYQLNSTYSLPKLLWLKRNRPEVLERTRHILWAKDYIRYRLTGNLMTDFTEAGGAALLDWDSMQWAVDRMDWCGLDVNILPPLHQTTDDGGKLLPHVAADLGLNPHARVLVGVGDVLALITGAPPQYGQVTCSLGTSSMIFMPVPPGLDVQDAHDRIYIYPLLPYRLMGGVSSTTGASLQWAWQAFYEGGVAYDEAIGAAIQTPPGAGGAVFLPFLTGERSPYWNDAMRGAFYGLTLAHTRAHMVRAVMEGVAYSLRYLLGVFRETGLEVSSLALAGGGTRTSGWAQMMADVCDLPVAIYSGQGTVTHGLYAYACRSFGLDESFEDALLRTFHPPRHIRPDKQNALVYHQLFEKYALLADFSHNVLSG